MDNVVVLALVVGSAWFGGFLINLTRGYKFPNCAPFYGKEIHPLSTKILIPPLIGMIICGCLAKNFFGPYMDNWND